VIPACSATRS